MYNPEYFQFIVHELVYQIPATLTHSLIMIDFLYTPALVMHELLVVYLESQDFDQIALEEQQDTSSQCGIYLGN